MILLAKTLFSVFFRTHRGVLIGHCGRVHLGHREDGYTPWTKNSVKFPHCGKVVRHMLKHIAGNHDIVGTVLNGWHVAHVELEVAIPPVEVGRCMFSGNIPDALSQLAFGCKMQDVLASQKMWLR